jgi:hypothetical protein
MQRSVFALTAALCILFFSAHLSAAEDPRDFSGVWQVFAASPAPEPEAVPEFTPDGEIRVADFAVRYPNPVDPAAYCVPAGVPDMMATPRGTIEVVQTFRQVTLLGANGQVRRVFIDDRMFPEQHGATSAGYSIGHWENDTLIIETRFLDEWLTGRWPRTQGMVVNERVTKIRRGQVSAPADPAITTTAIDDDVLEVALTFTDPELYREPQQLTVYYQHLGDEALPAQTCEAELWQQALDAANQ